MPGDGASQGAETIMHVSDSATVVPSEAVQDAVDAVEVLDEELALCDESEVVLVEEESEDFESDVDPDVVDPEPDVPVERLSVL